MMNFDSGLDEDLIRRLPLPLAKLYRHAANAKSPLDRHQAAYFLWEASLKLLAISAIVSYADRAEHDPHIADGLKSLARPALGEWRKYLRMLLPALAADNDSFRSIKNLLEQSRDDLPRAAGLDAVLRETLESKSGARSTVRLDELFDRLVKYRNQELGHGAAGLRTPEFYDRVGKALLAAMGDILHRLDVLAGRRLIYIADVARTPSGNWHIERFELIGEMPRRLEPLELPASVDMSAVIPGRVYLESADSDGLASDGRLKAVPQRTPLNPLAMYDASAKELLLLNSQRNRNRCDYLCYSSGEVTQADGLAGQMSDLLGKIFGVPVGAAEVEQWASQSPAEADNSSENAAGAQAAPALKTIGEFELLSKLGQGGMGVVYRAWQPSVGRQVALKCLLRAGDPKSAERFAREYRALGRVDHPHLVKVYTSGAEGDQWFYAMELIEGAPLAAVCERLQAGAKSVTDVAPDTWRQAVSTTCEEARRAEQPLAGAARELADATPAEHRTVPPIAVDSYVRHVVELIRQSASAAHKLHEAGVVHRDIKPGNIMLTADGAQAVLMDLGLAQWTDKEKLTRTRQFVGTLRYASPEQVLAVDRLDGRSDVYSLGATLWELLTLRPMFGATDETPTPELMKRIQFEDAELIGKHHSGVPRDLQAIVAKCLEKNPEHRYNSAGALADDLGRWLRNEPVQAQPTNWRYRAGKFGRRNRRAIAAGVGLLLVVLLAFYLGHKAHVDSEARLPDAILSPHSDRSGPIAAITPTGKRRAVLIGCNYPTHRKYRLYGPVNDALLLQSLLTERLSFSPRDVRTLTDADDSPPESLPTRANIEQAMQTLASELSTGDQAVILLGGNSIFEEPVRGTGGPRASLFLPTDVVIEAPKATNRETDEPPPAHRGLGVAADSEGKTGDNPAGGPHPKVTGAISGDDMLRWLKPLIEKHASVWVICDLCYGGFAQQVADSVKYMRSASGDVVMMYACGPNEETQEMSLPQGSPSATPHGIFSYAVCETLARSSKPPTYADLVERIKQRYASEGRTSPTPWCIGRGLDRPILGGAGLWDAPFRIKYVENDRYKISAGNLLGLSKGCILKVMAADDVNHPTLGQLRVIGSTDNEATAVPVEFGEAMAVGSWAQLAFIDFGSLRQKVAASPQTRGGEKVPQATVDRLEILLNREARRHGTAIEVVAAADQPDWVLLMPDVKSDSVLLAPASALLGRGGEQERFLGPFPISDLSDELPQEMAAIARTNNLLTLAQVSTAEMQRGQKDGNVKLEMLKFTGTDDKQETALSWRDGPPQLKPGDTVGWRLTNLTDAPVDATLLFIDSEMNTTAVFPRTSSKEDNRLPPHGSVLTAKGRVTATTSGVEHVVLISAAAAQQAADFSFLEGASLEMAFSTSRGADDVKWTLNTPLGKLLQNAVYGEGQQRGLSIADINRFPIRSLSWRVTPKDAETKPHSGP